VDFVSGSAVQAEWARSFVLVGRSQAIVLRAQRAGPRIAPMRYEAHMSLLTYLRDRPPAGLKFRHRQLSVDIPSGRTLPFPPGFLWGAASASHQVEGGDTGSDWWRFERLDGKTMNFRNFPVFAQDHKSDHWRQFDADVARMRDELGLTAYRFSIDWSRCEPRDGDFDEAALARYGAMVEALRDAGIRPLVTLFHWSSPDWIWDHAREEETGWYAPTIVDRFLRFVRRIVPVLAPHVDLFATFNEPNIFLYGGFAEGILAPGHMRRDSALVPVLRHLLRAHAGAYRIIKEIRSDAQVGIAHQFAPFEPESNLHPLEWALAGRIEQTFTWLFPEAIRTGRFEMVARDLRIIREELPEVVGTADFMGVNFYERMHVRVPGGWRATKTMVVNDHRDTKERWPRESNPAAFVAMLEEVNRRFGLPIYITENGRAHPDDTQREAFLLDHLRALAWAIQEKKLPVKGYFWWSLLDNQEWANGFLPRLGLYEVDYAREGARTLRGTGRTYADIIRKHAVRT
jgi:beta-glucosidase